jgi:DNA-binding transcriptional LysR family regulator
MFDWNDLKYLLAVARHRGTAAAGRALGVNQSTVQRRLVELERCMGQALVQRHPSGYRLTALGEQLLPLAQQVELAATALT